MSIVVFLMCNVLLIVVYLFAFVVCLLAFVTL